MAGNNNNNKFNERKSWMSTQRQSLGPDWTSRVHPDNLNRDIERVVRDLYFGNMGETNVNTNPDFRDLCSYTIVSALYNYFGTKITNVLPIYEIVQNWKQLRLNSVNQIAEEFRQAELEKIYLEINNIPSIHFIDEVYEYYYKAYSLLTGFMQSNFTDFTYMDNLCRLVFKTNNRWGNPNSRFI